MTEALKPCPFCGDLPSIVDFGDPDGAFGKPEGYVLVCCAGPDGIRQNAANGELREHRECAVEPEVQAPNRAEAVAAWNTRALPSPATDAGEARKAPQWADDRDPTGDLAIKLAARASAIEEQEGRGEWTWREIAECAAEALDRSPTFADGAENVSLPIQQAWDAHSAAVRNPDS